jgi:hypothetical protein
MRVACPKPVQGFQQNDRFERDDLVDLHLMPSWLSAISFHCNAEGHQTTARPAPQTCEADCRGH